MPESEDGINTGVPTLCVQVRRRIARCFVPVNATHLREIGIPLFLKTTPLELTKVDE